MKTFQILKRPLVTEKGTLAEQAANHYCFEVDRRANKHDIRAAVESIFRVKVEGVRTMNVPGKRRRVGKSAGRTSDWKKAIVTLREGDRIEHLEGA